MQGIAALDVVLVGDREVQITRIFNAPRQLVFDAHVKPALVQRWLLGPDGWSMPVCEFDARPGGKYRYVWRNDSDGTSFGIAGIIREIDPPKRIVHTERWDDNPGESVVTTEFVEKAGKTTMTMLIGYASKEVREAALQTGMTDGMATSYDRLDAMLADLPAA